MSIDSKDDQVLALLYKQGTKETPAPELDSEILDYAAKNTTPMRSGSYFGSGWKVPLSLAASVLVVFALLIQLDQHPEQLEIPLIPTSEKSDSKSAPKNEINIGDSNKPNFELRAPGHDSLDEAEKSQHRADTQSSAATPSTSESRKKLEQQETLSRPETTLGKTRQFDDSQFDNDLDKNQAPDESPPVTSPSAESKASNLPAPETAEPDGALERKREFPTDTSSENQQSTIQQKENSALLPAEDWLIRIEQLIARKDYAEAARQLEIFKQTHPEVNVSDLESKLP